MAPPRPPSRRSLDPGPADAGPTGAADATRQRLLEAAGEIFAARGFEAATVAEITRRAGLNVASVNYHFGDKLGLYVEVLRWALPARELLGEAVAGAASAEEGFVAFVGAFLRNVVGVGRPSWCNRLMAQEIAQNSPALAQVTEEVIRPTYQRLRALVAAVLDLPPGDEEVGLAAHSVIGQCVHWVHAQPLLPFLSPELRLDDEAFVDRLARHIATFSLGGLRAVRAAGSPPAAPRRPDPTAG